MHWTPTVCSGVMLGRQPQDPRNFKLKHGTGMEKNPVKWMEKQKLFVIKCFPCAWPSSLTCIITFRRVHRFGSVHQLLCVFVRRNTLWGREVSAFSLLPSFFFPSPASLFADADTSLFLARKAAYCLHPEKQCQYHSLDRLVEMLWEHFG